MSTGPPVLGRHKVDVRNQQNLYPRIPTTDVAKLLQYSGSMVEHGDGFSSCEKSCSVLKMVFSRWIFKGL